LALCAEDNMQVCYPTNAAQIFHLLRRQVIRSWRKPLIVMWPKSMLRKPEVASALEQLAKGKFQRTIADPAEAERVDRLLLCTGKVYYDLEAAWQSKRDPGIRIARIEQLYPFPAEELRQLIVSMPNLREIYWVQEEPRNLGAWRYMSLRLQDLVSSARAGAIRIAYVGRVETASPATGFYQAHVLEQKLIVDEALARGEKNGH
jgi:2-oxoglutarate dehydrogenase E1 component